MSDLSQTADQLQEARRQIEICNACRYCEGYCDVFPAITKIRNFTDPDVIQLANLCHNCRGCFYACQYTAPHEFDLNLPAILADVRADSWQDFIRPRAFARLLQRHSAALMLTLLGSLGLLILLVQAEGQGFYNQLPHNMMVALFAPAFLLPLLILADGLRRYWRALGGGRLRWQDLRAASQKAATLKNLSGGQGQGCNFEDEDRFSNLRRWFHQATLWGFMLCFGATVAGTLMHYLLGLPAPYGLISLPKLLGVPGGLLLSGGTAGLALLKLRGDRHLGAAKLWGAEMSFVLLLFLVSTSGLALWLGGSTSVSAELLIFHLATVFTFFITLPFTKMAHGAFRFAALLLDANKTSNGKGE